MGSDGDGRQLKCAAPGCGYDAGVEGGGHGKGMHRYWVRCKSFDCSYSGPVGATEGQAIRRHEEIARGDEA